MREIVDGDVDVKSFHVLIFSTLVSRMDEASRADHFAALESPNFCNSAARISSVIG
jgi:hypothetical protein